MTFAIRPETPADAPAIAALVAEAFLTAAHSSGREAAIVDGLRRDGGLLVSLVAEEAGVPTGHVAASPVRIGAEGAWADGWAGLGPLAVAPDRQGRGIGAALMTAALDRLRAQGHAGAVLVGYPDYYRRFGFAAGSGATVAGVPDDYVLALPFGAARPRGEIRFHPAFGL